MKARSYEVDELLSWARCSGDTLIVHLRLPGAELAAGAVGVELVSTSGRIRSTAVVTVEDGVAEVLLDIPRRELGPSTWRLSIQAGRDAGSVPVEARLLAAPGSPVALLPGPAPSTRMRPPTRRPPRPLTLRLADELPTPLRRALGRARTKARTVVGHLRR